MTLDMEKTFEFNDTRGQRLERIEGFLLSK